MINENVIQLPTPLERLAAAIRGHFARDAQNREEWIAIQEAICRDLAAARDAFPADIEFGQWCADNGFGEGVVNRDTRAAAIAMGREPEALRKCLEATGRRSLQHIYRAEFERFRQVTKPAIRRKSKLQLPRPSPKLELARDAIDKLQTDGAKVTVRSVAEAAQVSVVTADKAIVQRRAEAELDPLDPAEMRQSMRKRFELAVRKARAELRDEVVAEVNREYDVYVRRTSERCARADRIIASHRGVMSREAFRKIKACLHPDHNSFKYAAEALQLFGELEDALVKADEDAGSSPPLPMSAAELMARRRR